ncbi:MAG: thioredoxin domain-containing protein [Clostridiaceae bacterium]
MISNVKHNRLINEKSPYLLQHAYNPVDWFPWGKEAFEKAVREDKSIFLSIGYSSCHWCHVMEKESFEDEEIADFLNENFISIKVDREERPDLDNIYMTFTQAITGSGGWPMSVFLTPWKKPFYAGTYFPRNNKYGMIGFLDLLKQINNMWINEKEKIINSAEGLFEAINNQNNIESVEITEDIFTQAINMYKVRYDEIYGGFSHKPKFPIPHNILFLLRYWNKYKDEKSLYMASKTLEQMYKGGIFDHIGFGFSRYSTDEKWLAPHFEKMLYDNALFIIAYTEAYQATKDSNFKQVAEKIIKYISCEMTSQQGSFFSAEDADSEGVEGKFYLWTKEDAINILGKDDGELFCKIYDITDIGNFEGKSIPNLIKMDLDKIEEKDKQNLNIIREKLFITREKRIHPFKNEKIITSWNGLMIAALSKAGIVFENKEYIKKAKKAYESIDINFKKKLLFLDDYAFVIWGLINLYQASFEVYYLEKAKYLTDKMIELFYDFENSGFYINSKYGESLILRPKEIYDGAIPSGNSVAIFDMIKLDKITQNDDYKDKIENCFKIFGSQIKENPISYSFFLSAYMKYNNSQEIVLAGKVDDKEVREMIKAINKKYNPFTTVVINDEEQKLYDIAPFIKSKSRIEDKVTAYVCSNYTCFEPVYEVDKFMACLKS